MPAKTINVVLTVETGPECLKAMRAVSPGIALLNAAGLLLEEQNGDRRVKAELDSILSTADIVCGFCLPRDVVARSPHLKWIQVLSAGVDNVLNRNLVESRVKITTVSGIHAAPIAEFVLGLMLMFTKKMPLCMQNQRQKLWQRYAPGILCSKVIGIIGLGSIGREIARLAGAFGMKVIATRYSCEAPSKARYVDTLLPADQLHRLLSQSDFVVCALPLTPQTRGLIGKQEFRAMKQSAYFINIARGGIVDEAELIRALEEGLIAGAGLDVFSTEPLPADSPLWDMPDVIISPHVAGDMEDYMSSAVAVFIQNLKRYLAGKRLLNVVNKSRWY